MDSLLGIWRPWVRRYLLPALVALGAASLAAVSPSSDALLYLIFVAVIPTWAAIYSTEFSMWVHGTLSTWLLLAVVVLNDGNTRDDGFIVLLLVFANATAWVFRRVVRRDRQHSAQLEHANESLADLLAQIDRSRHEERHRIAGEIHDFSLQGFIASQMHVRRARATDDDAARNEALATAESQLGDAVKSLRGALRGVEPIPLYNTDLGTAVKAIAGSLETTYGVSVEVAFQEGLELPADQQVLVYRIIAEAATNAAKHAQPQRIVIAVASHGGELSLVVADDGRGFVGEIPLLDSPTSHGSGHGLGLRLMAEQVRVVGGTIGVDSGPGEGTTVRVRLPHSRA